MYEATFLVKLHKCLGEFLYIVLGKTVFFFALVGEVGECLIFTG